MPLNAEDVKRIAHLARLELRGSEEVAMLMQLNDFFKVVEQMSAVDTGSVEPLYTPLSVIEQVSLRLRDDVVSEAVDRDANQQSAPSVQDGLYLVPKVIE